MNDLNDYCLPACPKPPECDAVTGEYRFKGPKAIFSPNAKTPFPVSIITEDGKEHDYSTFGGNGVSEQHFDLDAEFIIRWSVVGSIPKCTVEEPVFYELSKEQGELEFIPCP